MRVIPTSWTPVILSRGTRHHPSCLALLRAKWRRVFVSLRFNIGLPRAFIEPNHETRDTERLVRFLTRQFGRLLTSHDGIRPGASYPNHLFIEAVSFSLSDNIYAGFNDTYTQSAFAHCAFITVRTIEQFIFNFTEERIQRSPFVFYITRGKSRRNKRIIKRFSSLAARFIDSQE